MIGTILGGNRDCPALAYAVYLLDDHPDGYLLRGIKPCIDRRLDRPAVPGRG